MSHQMTMPTNYFDKVEVLGGPNIGVERDRYFHGGLCGRHRQCDYEESAG